MIVLIDCIVKYPEEGRPSIPANIMLGQYTCNVSFFNGLHPVAYVYTCINKPRA